MATQDSRTDKARISAALQGEHADKLFDAIHALHGLAHCLRVLGRADHGEGRDLLASDALYALGYSMLCATARAFDALDALDMSLQGGAR